MPAVDRHQIDDRDALGCAEGLDDPVSAGVGIIVEPDQLRVNRQQQAEAVAPGERRGMA